MLPTQRHSRRFTPRYALLALGGVVALTIPTLQLLIDQRWPGFSKAGAVGVLAGLAIAATAGLPVRWQMRCLALSLMGCISLGLAEGAVALLLQTGGNSIYQWDSRLLYRPTPNTTKTFRRMPINGGQATQVAINSAGYRGPETEIPPRATRVVVYGDSFIEGEYSEWSQTFCEQLRGATQSRLQAPVAVINAGVNGFGPDQSVLRMEAEIDQLQPHAVVLSIFADNDFGDLLRNKLFRLDDAGKLVASDWVRSPDCLHPGLRGRYEPALWKLTRNAIRGLQSNTGTVESYMDRWLAQCAAEYHEYVETGNLLVHDLQADHYDADIALQPDSASARYKIRLLTQVLKRAAVCCKSRQIPLLVMVIPSPADLIEGYDFCRIDRQRFPQYNRRALSMAAMNAARAAGIDAVDLFDTFAAHQPAKLYFRGGDNHWNDAGQKLAAETLSPYLQPRLSSPSSDLRQLAN